MAKDPVCGMQVEPQSAAASAEHQGATYYFCSANCHDKFVQDPQRYAAGEDDAASRGGFLGRLFGRR